MNLRSFVFFLSLTLVLLGVGCGAQSHFDLGIPASKSESFFFHMKEAAQQDGYNAMVDVEANTLDIQTRNGNLVYQPNAYGDGLEVRLTTRAHQNNSKMEARWLKGLEKIHDKLLAKARILSKGNQVW